MSNEVERRHREMAATLIPMVASAWVDDPTHTYGLATPELYLLRKASALLAKLEAQVRSEREEAAWAVECLDAYAETYRAETPSPCNCPWDAERAKQSPGYRLFASGRWFHGKTRRAVRIKAARALAAADPSLPQPPKEELTPGESRGNNGEAYKSVSLRKAEALEAQLQALRERHERLSDEFERFARSTADESGRETCKRLGIDIPTWAAEIRQKIGRTVELSGNAPAAVQSVMLSAYAAATSPLESAGEKKDHSASAQKETNEQRDDREGAAGQHQPEHEGPNGGTADSACAPRRAEGGPNEVAGAEPGGDEAGGGADVAQRGVDDRTRIAELEGLVRHERLVSDECARHQLAAESKAASLETKVAELEAALKKVTALLLKSETACNAELARVAAMNDATRSQLSAVERERDEALEESQVRGRDAVRYEKERNEAQHKQLDTERERDALRAEQEREERWLREVVAYFRSEGLPEAAGILAARMDVIAEARATPPQQPSPSPSGAPGCIVCGSASCIMSDEECQKACDAYAVDTGKTDASNAAEALLTKAREVTAEAAAEHAARLEDDDPRGKPQAEAGDRPLMVSELVELLKDRAERCSKAHPKPDAGFMFYRLAEGLELLASRQAGGGK